MTKQEHIDYWLKSAKEDLETMNYLFDGGRYLHALFFGHLYIEKLSKALWVKNNDSNIPPKIHNILNLLKQANIQLDEAQNIFLLKLNRYQIEGRYPEDINNLSSITTKQLTLEYIESVKSIGVCLIEKAV